MGFFGSKSGRDNIVSGIKFVAAEIDESTLKDEEKVKYHHQRIGHCLKFMEMNTDQNSDRSKARRDIAQRWINSYLVLIFLTLVVKLWGTKDQYDSFIDMLTLMGAGTLMILGFYFGYYGIQGIVKLVKGEKKEGDD